MAKWNMYYTNIITPKHLYIPFLLQVTDDGRFACSNCDKTFTHKNHLSRHMKDHTGKYNHFCDVCRKGFARKYQYKEHMMVVHEGRRFYCDLCGKSFTVKYLLNKHVKDNHST